VADFEKPVIYSNTCTAHDPRVLLALLLTAYQEVAVTRPPVYATHIHLSTFMASPVVEDYPGSNLTQAQNGVNLPLTNPDIQGYAIRLSSECIFRPVAAGLRPMLLHIPPFEYRFYRTPMCR